MKKMLAFALSLMLLATMMMPALAADMGVQIIGGEMPDSEQVSLDDMALEAPAEIEGWGTITLTECKFQDVLYQYRQGAHTVAGNWIANESGQEADYLLIKFDVLNNTPAERDYLGNVSVKAVYADNVEFAGWAYQYNWDNETKDTDWDDLNGIQNKEFFIDVADQFPIMPYYMGHFCVGCTLPNAVVNGTEPLSLVVSIDGNELTYNVRQ